MIAVILITRLSICAESGILRSIHNTKIGFLRPTTICRNHATASPLVSARRGSVQRFLCVSPLSDKLLFAKTHFRCLGHVAIQNGEGHHHAVIIFRSFSTPSIQDQSSSSASSLSQQLQDQVQSGKLLFDPCQKKVANKLTRLQNALKEYDHDEYLRRLEEWDRYEEDTLQFEEKMQQQKLKQTKNEQNHKQTDSNDSSTKNISEPPKQPDRLPPVPRGIYLHGPVGTGKSLLLTALFNTTTTTSTHNGKHIKKLYIHFHSLLRQIHQRIHQLNLHSLRTRGRNFHVDTSKSSNPILRVAQELSREATLLCIDEFQVTDVADAMILSQLFGELWRRGVVVVATSNTIPGSLYEGGVNRGYFMGFVGMLEKYCLVVPLDGVVEGDEEDGHGDDVQIGDAAQDVAAAKGDENDGLNMKITKKLHRDYRRIKSGVHRNASQGGKSCGEYYFVLAESDADRKIEDLFQSFCQTDATRPYNTHDQNCGNDNNHDTTTPLAKALEIPVHFSRKITIQPNHCHSNIIARFTFDELCTNDLGSADYHAIANHFSIIVLRDIPYISLAKPDRARRFITLIDELYEAGCCLVCGAVDIPDRLFIGNGNDGDNDSVESQSDHRYGDKSDKNGNMLAVDVAQSQGVPLGQLASVKELSFAFERAKSRLLEMCSEAWWDEICSSRSIVGGLVEKST
ncbi:hypothetical protein ACHAXS_001436 [Conticribra weissflogii]